MRTKFFILWIAGIVSTVLALPYILTLQQDALVAANVSWWLAGVAGVVQAAVLLAVAVFFGLRLARRIGLSVFALEQTQIPRTTHITRMLTLAVPLGIGVALVIRGADFFFLPSLPALAVASERIAFWKALLVAPYGGIVEELLMRLFLVTLFAWILGAVTRTRDIVGSRWIWWTAIIAAALIFGLGHLPATAVITPLTPLVLTRALLLNGLGGLVFGWLYWKKGLEYAMVAHGTTDIVLHAVLPALLS